MFPANRKVGKTQKGKAEKWCNLHNSTRHSNQECFQQKSGSKCKYSPTTAVDGKNSVDHETFVVDRTTVDCKLCCCDGKIVKKSNK